MEQTLHNLMSEANKRGFKLLGVNTFGIVYADDNNIFHLLKLTPLKNKVDIKKISGFTNFGLAEHFISLSFDTNACKNTFSNMLFVKNLSTNLLGRFKRITPKIISNDGTGSRMGPVCGDFEVICIETNIYNGIYIVNYLGKKINISDYSERYYNIHIDLAVFKNGDSYVVGYSDQSNSEKIREGLFKSHKINHPILRTDKDFNNIEYLGYKTKGQLQ